MNTDALIFLPVLFIILWRIYGRYKAIVNGQYFDKEKSLALGGFFILIFIAFLAVIDSLNFLARNFLVGGLLGLAIGAFSVKITKFSFKNGNVHYVPNAILGTGVIFLLMIKIIYTVYSNEIKPDFYGRTR